MSAQAHSVISASSSDRWLNCPGSVNATRDLPDTSSEAADEGTAAHSLAEKCLLEDRNTAEFQGQEILVEKSDRSFEVTEEMAESVQLYLDVVRNDRAAMQPGVDLLVEQEFHLDWLHPDLWGSNDASNAQQFGLLRGYDLKYGRGVLVEVENNPQLKIYALGALQGSTCEEVEIVIVQPRAMHSDGPVRRWRISSDELYKWARSVLKPGAEAALKPDAMIKAGSWCKFCRAQATCSAVRQQATEAAMVVFGEETQIRSTLPPATALTGPQMAKVLQFSRDFSSWSSEVEAHAKAQLERGVDLPGWKLVAGKASRSWVDPEAMVAKLGPTYGDELYGEPKLLSPAAVEKLIKKGGGDSQVLMDGMVEVSRGKVLAPDSDKRAAIPSAIDAFKDAGGTEDGE